MAQYWYMLVTADKYELPLSPPMRSRDLAKVLGITTQTILGRLSPSNINRYSGYKSGKKFIRFYSDELDEMEKEK